MTIKPLTYQSTTTTITVITKKSIIPNTPSQILKTLKNTTVNSLFNSPLFTIDGKTIGYGIQQIPSYKCPIPYDELNKLREAFWESKTTNRAIWNVIRECCTTDHETAVLLLEAAGMACLEGDLRKVFLFVSPEYIFTVPNYCVCDPCFEKDFNEIETKANTVQEEKINIVCYYLAKNKDIVLEVSNKSKVEDVKKQFAKKIKKQYEKYSIRFLFKGQEMQNEHLLCYHDIQSMSKIQVMVRKLDNE